jgi:hypothetical protein
MSGQGKTKSLHNLSEKSREEKKLYTLATAPKSPQWDRLQVLVNPLSMINWRVREGQTEGGKGHWQTVKATS